MPDLSCQAALLAGMLNLAMGILITVARESGARNRCKGRYVEKRMCMIRSSHQRWQQASICIVSVHPLSMFIVSDHKSGLIPV